jgi:hypothetical protein
MTMTDTTLHPSEIELLLPWHAAGMLAPHDAERVEAALSGDEELARQYAMAREELAETVLLNEALGTPSDRAAKCLLSSEDRRCA